jgi:phage terminase large subunit-like protein
MIPTQQELISDLDEAAPVPQIEDVIDKMTPEELSLLAQIIEGQIREEELTNPLSHFAPNGAIEKFINAVGHDGTPNDHPERYIYVLAAANGVGKSAGVLAVLANIIWGPQNRWFHGHRFENWKHPKEFWYVSEQTTLKETIVGIEDGSHKLLQQWFPKGRYSISKAGQDYFSSFKSDTGWTGTFKTFDMDVEKFESATLGVIVFDEPPPEQLFNAAVSRLRKGGIILMPMTPLFSAAWVEDRLLPKADENGTVFLLEADIWENSIEKGTRGILETKYIERMIAEYDDEEREARAYGKFMHLVGLIYKGLHPAKHRYNDVDEKAPGYIPLSHFTQEEHRIFCVCDPHDAKPPLIGWFAVDRYDNVKVIKEFPSTDRFLPFHKLKHWKLTTYEVCAEIKAIEKEAGWDPSQIIRVMDPNFGKKSDAAIGMTVADYYRKCGRQLEWPLRFDTSVHDDLAIGHKIVRDFIAPNADGVVRMMVGMSCDNLWHDLTHYAYKRVEGKKLEQDGPSEKVQYKYKDGADLFRYFYMYRKGPKPKLAKPKLVLPEHYGMYGVNPYNPEPESGGIYDPDNM